MSLRPLLATASVLGLAFVLAEGCHQFAPPPGATDGDGGIIGAGDDDGGTSDGGGDDGGFDVPDGFTGATCGPSPTPGWLYTTGNRICFEGKTWHARGANLPDTRSCGACLYDAPSADEVIRRADALIDTAHANFIRLVLESYASAKDDQGNTRTQWDTLVNDAAYLADIQKIVRHINGKGVAVLVSLWEDPTVTSDEWPTAATNAELKKLATAFANDKLVLFGVTNEPEHNFDGTADTQVWTAMNDAVQAIRDAETAAGGGKHLVAVQGTGGWARRIDYYADHPIKAGNGENVVYETHLYNTQAEILDLLRKYWLKIPVIIGEFGPVTGDATMTIDDCKWLMDQAEKLEIPYLGWVFHPRCPPNLLQDTTGGGCGINMSLVPTDWGTALGQRLSQPY